MHSAPGEEEEKGKNIQYQGPIHQYYHHDVGDHVCWHHPVSVWVCAGGSRAGPQSAASVCVKSAQRRGRGGGSSTSQNLLTHKWNSQWVATGGSETSDRSELGERLGLGVGGDISPVAGQMNKLLNYVMCDVRGRDVRANTLGLSLRSYLGQIRGEEKCIGSSEIHLDPGDFLYIYVVHCHALSSGPAMARTRNTEFATKTHITARVVHTRALTTNDFQDLYFLAPALLPPPLASSCKIGRQLGRKTSQTNYGNIKCGMNNFCKIWEDRVLDLETKAWLVGFSDV